MASGKEWGSGLGGVVGGGAGAVLGGPLGAGIGMAAGGAIGGLVGGLFDDDENPATPPVYVDPSLYGTPGYDEYLASLSNRQAGYEGRAAPTMDFALANQDRQLALEARGIQGEAAQSYRDVLSGQAPSLAQQQLAQGLTAANAQAAQQAASTRGGAGNLVLAQMGAQRQAAGNSLATNSAMGQLRAQEMAAARQGLLTAGSQMRGQDLDMRGQSQGQTQMLAQNELAQRGLNDAMSRGLEQGRLAGLAGQQAARSQYASDVLQGQMGTQGNTAQYAKMAQDQRNRDQDYQRQMTGSVMQQGGQLAAMGMQQGYGDRPTDDQWKDSWTANGGDPRYA